MTHYQKSIVENHYPFSVEIPVRITDINYGGHLGHMAVVGIFHQVRLLFLNEYNIDEMNVEGNGVILLNSSYVFKNQAFLNDQLIVRVGIGAYSRTRFNFLYQASDKETGQLIVSSQEEITFFNYTRRKSSKIPESFLLFCESVQLVSKVPFQDSSDTNNAV